MWSARRAQHLPQRRHGRLRCHRTPLQRRGRRAEEHRRPLPLQGPTLRPHRFCGAEGLDKVVALSAFRCNCFTDGYGLLQTDGPLRGLLARAVVVIDTDGKILYTELVPEITEEPNYEAALAVLKK